MSIVEFREVTVFFGQQAALKDVSFVVPAGTIFALLGANGAGKTTSIKTMLGGICPNSGSATVLGMDPWRNTEEIRRQTGYVAEQPVFYDWMTVSEMGWFAAGFYGGDYEAEFHRLISNFSVAPQKKLTELSRGMRAKVGLALAMAHRPPLLILDEPTSGLDTLVRRQFLESMVELTASGQTVLLSSHQIPEVERVCDRVGIIKEGKLLVVEELDSLKSSCREVIVTFEDRVDGEFFSRRRGQVLHARNQGRQCVAMVRHFDENEILGAEDEPGVASIDLRHPSLEEIFVAYMEGAPRSGRGSIPEQMEVWR